MQKPEFVEQVVVEEEDPTRNSLLVVDSRDERLLSPFQNWLLSEIMSNAASSINVLTERDRVMPPNSGYHCSRTTRSTASRRLCPGPEGLVPIGTPMPALLCPTRLRFTALFSRSLGLASYVGIKYKGPHWQRGPVPVGVQRIPIGL